jgi:DNA-directed RNA polymerase specialized sigma24 family protein
MGRKKALIFNTPPNHEVMANAFMRWYGANLDDLKRCVIDYDEDLFTDAFLRAYEAIRRCGTIVKDYKGYFLQSYRSTFLDSKKKAQPDKENETAITHIQASEYDYMAYEKVVDDFKSEILDYVQNTYNPFDVSLFEIYIGLLPDISYKRMSEMLGIPTTKIWPAIGAIKKDVAEKYGKKCENLLSIVSF